MSNLLLLLQSVVVAGGTVHSQVEGEAPRVADVLVVDGRIEAVGPDLERPEGAEVVDARGKHVVPGLVDGMIHHDLEHDPLYVHAGVTTARDLGNDLGRIFLTAQPNVRDNAPGPALWICGAVLDGVPPATTEAIVVTSPEEVEDKVGRLLELDPTAPERGRQSVDFLAFHLGVPTDAWLRAIEIGHDHDLQVWGPAPRGATLKDVLDADQDGLLYLEALLPRGEDGAPADWSKVTLEDLRPAVDAVAEAGLKLTPMLRVYAYRVEDPGEDPIALSRLSPQYASAWRRDLEVRRRLLDEEYVAEGQRIVAVQQELLRALFEAGVPLVPGSGAPNPWLLPGDGLHEELALWEQAGIPPADVLHLATAGAAEALGFDDERGRVAPGQVADLLVVTDDPREGVAALRSPEAVLLRGRVLDREELDLLLRRLIEAQAAVRERDALPIEVELPELPEGAVVLSGYVESTAYGQRFSGERYAVVREPDGKLAYVGRVITPGGVGAPATDLLLLQRIEEVESPSGGTRPQLAMFELEVKTAGNVIQVDGVRVGGQFQVRRRLNGLHVDTNAASLRPMLVDAGSATAALILAHHVKPGIFDVVYFEDLDPAVGQWAMDVKDGLVRAQTLQGPLVATFGAHGGLDKLERVQGRGRVRMEARETRTFGGPGVALPRERVHDASAPAPASAPTGGETDEPPPAGGEDPGGEDEGGGDATGGGGDGDGARGGDEAGSGSSTGEGESEGGAAAA